MTSRLVYIRRRRQRRNGNGHVGSLILKILLALFAATLGVFVVSLGVAVGSAVSIYTAYAQNLPDPGEITRQTSEQFKTTKIYDRSGQVLLYELIDPEGGDRTNVSLDRIPQNLIDATIAIEDKNFWTNPGVDLYGIARAAYSTVRGEQVQGASTITQQLVKNVLIPVEERGLRDPRDIATYNRKLKEIILANEIARRYDKKQILEWYLNTVSYGGLAYGVEAASEAYFGKHVQDLSLSEAATLAALPQWPGMNPIDNPDDARRRRDVVLDQMLLQGYITTEQALEAKAEKIRVSPKKFDINAPHFVFYVRRLLEERYGAPMVYKSGLKVYTTLDYTIQQQAEQIARDQVKKLTEEKRNVTNASVVVLKPSTGEIVAMVGSIDYFNRDIDGQVNIAISPRQPGSSFKLYNYLTAFSQGYTAATMIMDVRTVFDDAPNPPYVPENYDRKYHGPVRLRTALASSFNIPAVKLLQKVGVRNVLDMAHRMGINTLNSEHYGLSLTLGGGEVTLLDMTYAYGVVANGGAMAGTPVPEDKIKAGYRTLDPVAILKVVDANGKVLDEFTKPELNPVVTPQQAYLITDILSDNNARAPAFGLNSVLKLSRPAAVKTGTTSDWRDNWTLGFTPDYAVGVWVGNADNAEMEHISGVSGAGPIWHDVMEKIHANLPVHPFVEPPGMNRVEICATSGLLPTPYCPERRKEIFIAGTEPKTFDDIWKPFRIFKPNGKLATAFDPPEEVEEKVFPIFPAEAADWVRENNIAQPPQDYDTTYGTITGQGGDVAITSPAPYAYIHGMVPIMGNARIGDLQLYRLAFGQGIDPTAWTQIGGDHGNRVENNQLEVWDVSALDGLYTLKLTAVDNGGGLHESTIQVTVDNQPPKVKIIHPENGDVYVQEKDEWVSIGVDAADNISMSRVDFFVDGGYIGATTVAPYNKRWTIRVRDDLSPTLASLATISPTLPLDPNAPPPDPNAPPTNTFTVTRAYTLYDGTPIVEDLVGTVISETRKGEISPTITAVFTTGMTIISNTWTLTDTFGITETHVITVTAYDAAGNSTTSQPITIYVTREKKPAKPSAWFGSPDLPLARLEDFAWIQILAALLPRGVLLWL